MPGLPTAHKNRLNFLTLLRVGETQRAITLEGLPQELIERLSAHAVQDFADENAWQAHLAALGIDKERHQRIASEGIQCGCLLQNDLWERRVIVGDDAGQFNVPGLLHAAQKSTLEARFDAIFTQKTEYATLNSLLKRLYRNKAELLQVLDHPQENQWRHPK